MLRVKCLTGPYRGRVRVMPPEMNPAELLGSFLDHGWDWEVDYTQATGNEAVKWGRADLTMRAIRAIKKGLPVKFLGKVYSDPVELEDAIVYSGKGISIGKDDETGVEITAHDLPQPEPAPWAALRQAQEWIEVHSQELIEAGKAVPSWQKKNAFARAVAALVANFPLGTVGGPSSREYAAIRAHRRKDEAGSLVLLSFEEAVEILSREEGLMFGPITELHLQCWVEEYCFDDDPEDVEKLKSSTDKPE